MNSARKQPALRPSGVTAFRRRLLAWYDANRRDLPWRKDHDPYRVWLSEIMLQQTRVAAVIEHYQEFLRRFPSVRKLALARESSVLAAWSGLGYYRRARMMHATAKTIIRENGGKFPATAEQWRTLPGIGRYTAAAIASIASAEPVAAVDGNVERVLQRASGKSLSKQELWALAERTLDRKRPGDFNQSVMELGALVCTSRAPLCLTCPIAELCATRGELPASGMLQLRRKRELHYALSYRDSAHSREVFLVRRAPDASLLANMWELPETADLNPRRTLLFKVRHSITVTDYTVCVWSEVDEPNSKGEWISAERLPKVALTGLARKILRKAEIF